MCDSNKQLYHSHIPIESVEYCVTNTTLSPTVAKLRHTSRVAPSLCLTFLSLGVKARLLQAAVSITTPHSRTATSTSSLISSLSSNPSTNHSPSVTPYLSRRLLNTSPLAHDMKLKKLAVALATTPFGIAAALTAPGSVPPYGNVSVNDTAAIDPYVYIFFLPPALHTPSPLSLARPYQTAKEPSTKMPDAFTRPNTMPAPTRLP